MRYYLLISLFAVFLLAGCGSIDSVKDKKDEGDAVVYKTSFENAWVYTKKIFKQSGIEIREENKKKGAIFGKSEPGSSNNGSYVGVWITPINDNQVSVSVYSEMAIHFGYHPTFKPEDFHKEFKMYVDTE